MVNGFDRTKLAAKNIKLVQKHTMIAEDLFSPPESHATANINSQQSFRVE